MTAITRRGIVLGGGALLGLAACDTGVGKNGAEVIDARVDATRDYLASSFPGTRDMTSRAVGILYFPLVTEAALGIGGGYGRGALRIGDITVDYYSAARGSYGFQIGAQQYAHALFFMTEEALGEFRRSPAWSLSADAKFAVPDQGGSIGKDVMERLPVIPLVFGQSGLMASAAIAGIKYTRIIP
jgi:lipid-binding SYLF domain-containing protein